MSRNPSRHTPPDHHLHSSPPGKRSTTPSQRISTPQTRLWMTTRDTPQQGSLSFSFYGGPIWYSTRWVQKRHQPHLSQHTHHSPRECERRNTRISSPIYIERPQRSEAVLCINEGLCSMFYESRSVRRLLPLATGACNRNSTFGGAAKKKKTRKRHFGDFFGISTTGAQYRMRFGSAARRVAPPEPRKID